MVCFLHCDKLPAVKTVGGGGGRVGSGVAVHGLLALPLSLWAYCKVERHGEEGTAKQKASAMIGLGGSGTDRQKTETR